MTEQTVNIPLLRKAVEWAEAEAAKPWATRQWYQPLWAAEASLVSPSLDDLESGISARATKAADCGTCYCIAGFVTSLAAADERAGLGYVAQYGDDGEMLVPKEYATQALGLNRQQAVRLFDANNDIEDVRRIAESIAGERL